MKGPTMTTDTEMQNAFGAIYIFFAALIALGLFALGDTPSSLSPVLSESEMIEPAPPEPEHQEPPRFVEPPANK